MDMPGLGCCPALRFALCPDLTCISNLKTRIIRPIAVLDGPGFYVRWKSRPFYVLVCDGDHGALRARFDENGQGARVDGVIMTFGARALRCRRQWS